MRREGSVKQAADRTWGFVVDIAPSGALRRQVRRRGFRTKAEAQRELTKVLHSLGEGTFVAPERLTLASTWSPGWRAWPWPGSGRRRSLRTGSV